MNRWVPGFIGYYSQEATNEMKKEDELYIKKLQEALELWQNELEKCKSYSYWYENYYNLIKEKQL